MDRKICQIYIFKNKMDLKKNDTLLLHSLTAEVWPQHARSKPAALLSAPNVSFKQVWLKTHQLSFEQIKP